MSKTKKKKIIKPKIRAPHKPTKVIKDKTKYNRKEKHKKTIKITTLYNKRSFILPEEILEFYDYTFTCAVIYGSFGYIVEYD